MSNERPLRFLTRQQSRRVDEVAMNRFGFDGLVLMENAGRGCVDLLLRLGIDGPVTIFCGSGNNGGDGFVIARHLKIRGFEPWVLLFGNPSRLATDAAANWRLLKHCDVPTFVRPEKVKLPKRGWIVDSLLGTGAVGKPREPIAGAIRDINAAKSRTLRVLAVDLPSGLDADTGKTNDPTVRADKTATFVGPKIGFRSEALLPFLGEVHVVGIGIPESVVDAACREEDRQFSR